MTALFSLILGIVLGLGSRRWRSFLWGMLLPVMVLLITAFIPPRTLGERILEHQGRRLQEYLHIRYESLESVARALANLDYVQPDDIDRVMERAHFHGWWTLYDESGSAMRWNHHILRRPVSGHSALSWTLEGWLLTKIQKVKGGEVLLALPQEKTPLTFGIDQVLYFPLRQFAPLLEQTTQAEAVYLWKEQNVPPMLQVKVSTLPFTSLKSSAVRWMYGQSILFLIGFILSAIKRVPFWAPLFLRILLIPVPWASMGFRGWYVDSTQFSLTFLYPWMATALDTLLTLCAVGWTIMLLRPRLIKRTRTFRGLIFVAVTGSFILLTLIAAGNFGESSKPFWGWVIAGLILMTSLMISIREKETPGKTSSLLLNGIVLVLMLSTPWFPFPWPALIVVALVGYVVLRGALSPVLLPLTLVFMTLVPTHYAREDFQKRDIELQKARRTVHRSLLQLAYLNGPVITFFKDCDLTNLFPHAAYLTDWDSLASILARESGLLARGTFVSLSVVRNDRVVSTYSNVAIPEVGVESESFWQVTEEQVFGYVRPIYHATFPVLMEGRPWGNVLTRVMVDDPRIPLNVSPWKGRHRPHHLLSLYGRNGELLSYEGRPLLPALPPAWRAGYDRWIYRWGTGWIYRVRDGNNYYLFAVPDDLRTFPFTLLGLAFLLGCTFWVTTRPFPRGSLVRQLLVAALSALVVFFICIAILLGMTVTYSSVEVRQQVFLQRADQLARMADQLLNDQALDDPQIGYLLSELAGSHLLLYRQGHLVYSTLLGLGDFEPTLRDLRPSILEQLEKSGFVSMVSGAQSMILISLPGSLTQVAFSRPREDLAPALPRWFDILAGTGLTLFGLLLLFILASSRKIVSPLLHLTQEARSVMSGELSHLSVQYGAREVETLSQALVSMVDTLRKEKESLAILVDNLPPAVALVDKYKSILQANEAFRNLLSTVSLEDILQAKNKMVSAGQEWQIQQVPLHGDRMLIVAEDLTDVMKSERYEAWFRMARIIAHEIKNPLTPLRLTLDYINEIANRNPKELLEELPQLTVEMIEQMDELNRTASEFSDFAKITEAHKELFDFRNSIEQWLAPFLHHGNVTILLPEGPVWIEGDERLLRRAVLNIMNNALQSSSPSPPVEVLLSASEETTILSISDEGPGVPDAMLYQIFEPYFSTKVGGTGLGLAIARRIISDHGGHVEAENRENGGFIIRIHFPPGKTP
ncbi:MAG TPA: ATP-binding protein [Thermoanaerobaculia bacterium]|nr:ATP-binding protein [Thermoanaerobaculia bacterium]HUM28925.1 ATP-binding protein [Thermoanaerobaculia bacterium]HXK67142.1 ATP-binding protein [Thermoanaerobaculia bacterium]